MTSHSGTPAGKKHLVVEVHSNILIHWTGAKLRTSVEYVDRLKSICRPKDDGQLWLHPHQERLKCAFNKTLDLPLISILCFTEIQPHLIDNHAAQYGKLAIGFTREFLIERGANPVLYLPSNVGAMGINLKEIRKKISDKHLDGLLDVVLGYVKPMGDGLWDYQYYDEMEWRIIQLLLNSHLMTRFFKKVKNGQGEDRVALKFKGSDVEVLIFPDQETKRLAQSEESLKEFFEYSKTKMKTIDEYKSETHSDPMMEK